MDQDVVTDPPPYVVQNMNPKIDFAGTNYEHYVNEAMKYIMNQIDNFESKSCGWIVDKFQNLDLKIAPLVLWR